MTAEGLAELLVNPEQLSALYGRTPALTGVRVRSVNLNWRGPELTLRIDLPAFPASPPVEWEKAGVDRVQCQLRFTAVERIALTRWSPPAVADIEVVSWGGDRRVRVAVGGEGVALAFEASDSVRLAHVSAFRIDDGGSDAGTHLFLGKVDARRHSRLPGTEEKTFYER